MVGARAVGYRLRPKACCREVSLNVAHGLGGQKAENRVCEDVRDAIASGWWGGAGVHTRTKHRAARKGTLALLIWRWYCGDILADDCRHDRQRPRTGDSSAEDGARMRNMEENANQTKTAAGWLLKAVRMAQKDPDATAKSIATYLELGRVMGSRQGAADLLPHHGVAEDRIALFIEAIEELKMRRRGGRKPLNPRAVVSACARKLGYKGEIF
jgi:hypothetical protein